jgi:hypothetical protein
MVWLSAFTMVIRCEPAERATAVGLAVGFVVVPEVALLAVGPGVPVALARADMVPDAFADAPDGWEPDGLCAEPAELEALCNASVFVV